MTNQKTADVMSAGHPFDSHSQSRMSRASEPVKIANLVKESKENLEKDVLGNLASRMQ